MNILPGPPGNNLTWADHAFLRRWGWCKYCHEKNRPNSKEHASSHPPCLHMNPEIDAQRREGLLRFILSLSDQQLVTGLAMTIAALVQRCHISCYEFSLVTSFAWLASMTHIGTLVVLRNYFREKRIVRNIRVSAMFGNMVLLLYVTLENAAASEVDNSAPIQCVLRDPSLLLQDLSIDWSTLPTVFIIIMQYIDAIFPLYQEMGPSQWLIFHSLRRYCCKYRLGLKLSEDQFGDWYEENVIEAPDRPGSIREMERLRARATSPVTGRIKRLQQRLFYLPLFVFEQYGNSFLAELPNFIFNATYGITQLIIHRLASPNIIGSMNTVDFGQLVPLFLLAIPALTAIEIYNDVPSDQQPKNKSFFKRFEMRINSKSENVPGSVETVGRQLRKLGALHNNSGIEMTNINLENIPENPSQEHLLNSNNITQPHTLANGWEGLARTGKIYFVNQSTRTTTWTRPIQDTESASMHGVEAGDSTSFSTQDFDQQSNSNALITSQRTLKPSSFISEAHSDSATLSVAKDLDSPLSDPFAKPEMHNTLDIIFWLSAINQFLLGVLLLYFQWYGILWLVGWIISMTVPILQTFRFYYKIVQKARHLAESDLRPGGGTRAPPPSVRSLVFNKDSAESLPPDPSLMMHGARSDSPVSVPDDVTEVNVPQSMNGLRRRTTDLVANSRTTTRTSSLSVLEANIGI